MFSPLPGEPSATFLASNDQFCANAGAARARQAATESRHLRTYTGILQKKRFVDLRLVDRAEQRGPTTVTVVIGRGQWRLTLPVKAAAEA
jgi:hypothetical protein